MESRHKFLKELYHLMTDVTEEMKTSLAQYLIFILPPCSHPYYQSRDILHTL